MTDNASLPPAEDDPADEAEWMGRYNRDMDKRWPGQPPALGDEELAVHPTNNGTGLTPTGDPIHTETIWLPFADGEVAITVDLTKFDAAMRRLPRRSA